jgi:hypothetical protein
MTKRKSLHREIISMITYLASITDACFLYPSSKLNTNIKVQPLKKMIDFIELIVNTRDGSFAVLNHVVQRPSAAGELLIHSLSVLII